MKKSCDRKYSKKLMQSERSIYKQTTALLNKPAIVISLYRHIKLHRALISEQLI